MTEICDPLGGWSGIGHVWAHCRGLEDACVEVELIDVSATQARANIMPSWRSPDECVISKGAYEQYNENGTVWRVYCVDVNKSQALAKIRICYEDDAAEGMKVGDTKRVGIMAFTLSSIVCTPVQKITAWSEGVSKTIKLGAWGVFPGPFIMGGLYVLFESVNAACDAIIEKAAEGGLTPEDVEEIDTLLEAEYTRPDGTKPTPEEIHKVKMGVIDGFDYTDPEYVAMVENLMAGTITKAEFDTWLKQYTIDRTKIELDTVYYTGNFSLEIPMFVMAGEVKASGTAPQPNQEIQIVAVKKFFGFDYLAADEVLATVTSDSEYKYEATLHLDEFGIIEVYAKIPKIWWNVLEKDLTTTKHTVFVLTWAIILFLLIAAILVYDKKTGKLGLLKKKR